jgi:hypothetical protein
VGRCDRQPPPHEWRTGGAPPSGGCYVGASAMWSAAWASRSPIGLVGPAVVSLAVCVFGLGDVGAGHGGVDDRSRSSRTSSRCTGRGVLGLAVGTGGSPSNQPGESRPTAALGSPPGPGLTPETGGDVFGVMARFGESRPVCRHTWCSFGPSWDGLWYVCTVDWNVPDRPSCTLFAKSCGSRTGSLHQRRPGGP